MGISFRHRGSWSVLFALLIPACGDGSADQATPLPQVTSRDSAGLVIVENHVPAGEYPVALRVTSEPSIRIGRVTGTAADQLFRVRGAVHLDDGRIAILNGGTQEVRVFGPDGEFLVQLGGQGDGPGEFQFAAHLSLVPPDTIVVWDGLTWEASWFDTQGNLLRSEPGRHQFADLLPEDRFVEGGAALPGTGMLLNAYKFGARATPGEARRPDLDLVFINTAARESHVIEGNFDGLEQVSLSFQGRQGSAPVPFGRSAFFGVGGRPPAIWGGDTDVFELRQFDAYGRLERLVRLNEPRVAVTGADAADYLDRTEQAMRIAGVPDSILMGQMEMVRSVEPADSMPTFGQVYVTTSGGAWVSTRSDWIPGSTGRAYHVFSADGRWRGVVRAPVGARILEIGDDYLLALRTDELDVEFVELFSLSAGR
ncbi:MAG: 6-bladed beta-propeller [Gemmatimonadota bacterium]